jgi:molecular chaperone GrpE
MTEETPKQEETDAPEILNAEDPSCVDAQSDDAAPQDVAPLTPEEKIEALETEREDTIRYGASALAKDLLNVADNLQRALQSVPSEARESDDVIKNLVIGIEMTEKELLSAMQKQGVEKIEPLGEKFSYDKHQAMFEVPDTGKPAGTIVELMPAGRCQSRRYKSVNFETQPHKLWSFPEIGQK